MSLLSDVKLAAQIFGLVILIITLIPTLRWLITNNTATATQILPGGGNDGVTDSSQDNVQMIALNVINALGLPIYMQGWLNNRCKRCNPLRPPNKRRPHV